MGTSDNPPGLPEASGPLGDLVVQNGRMSGARRPLAAPLTLIGQAAGCEVRLNVEGVNPLHCALVPGPAGPLLRDLGSTTGTRVNGERVATRELRHGDVLEVGPFRFILELPPITVEAIPVLAGVEGPASQAERDALRVQVAAVASQHAELTEEEARLRQRATALERQEKQLAAHLDERREKLRRLQNEVRQERTAAKEELAATRTEIEEGWAALERERGEVGQVKQRAEKERRRCVELRKRLKRRWKDHFQAAEAALAQREAELAAGGDKVERDAEALRRERERFHQSQLRFNGESCLARGQLREEWQQLGLAQQQWEECLNEEHSERERRTCALEERAAAVTAAEQALAEEQRRWQQSLVNLRREVEGLEVRVRHQRHQLNDPRPPAPVAPSPPPAPPAPVDARQWPAYLREVAGQVADQRAHLAEQWQRLLEVHERWQQERGQAQDELEVLAGELEQRERRLQGREQELAVALAGQAQRQEAVAQTRSYLEGWQARLTARSSGWEAERAALLGEVEARELLLAARSQRIEDVHRRRTERRRQEVADLVALRGQCEEARRQYASLWEECQERCQALAQGQRSLSRRALALERYRQEVLARAPSSAKAERRLRRLQRQDAARLAGAEADVQAERQALLAEATRLQERYAQLQRQEEALLARQEEMREQMAEWESRQSTAEEEHARLRIEVQRHEARHAVEERHLAELRDEVERIARLLIDEGEPGQEVAKAA